MQSFMTAPHKMNNLIMKRLNSCLICLNGVKLCSLLLLLMIMSSSSRAQGPQGKDFGFGLILGEPLGGTVKFWTSAENAIVGDIGASYFGSPRIQGDYLWHF